jgi:hypothetical protein
VAGSFQYHAGALAIAGASLEIDSVTVSIGKNSTTDVTIGSAAVKAAAVDGQSVSIGNTASSVSIGGADATINLQGKVTVNGEDLDTRRRLSAEQGGKAFGYLDVKKFSQPVERGHARFSIPFQSGFASDPSLFQLDSATERFLSVAMDNAEGAMDADTGRHVRLSLDIARLRLQIGETAVSGFAPSKIRYEHSRVYCRELPAQHAR